MLLDAESGGGKSRLLAELASQAVGLGITVLRGQGIRDGVQLPFTLVQGVARDLVNRDDAAPLRTALRERLGESAQVTANVLAPLRPLLDLADDDTGLEAFGPDAFGEERSLAALRHFLSAMATPENPVLLVLDDCQWADALTVRLLVETFGSEDDLPAHLGIVAAFRSEEVPDDAPLRSIATAKSLHLGELSDSAMTLLAESMAGPLPAKAVATVTRLADGSPFMGAAVLRGLVECGALTASDGGWLVDDAALAEVQTERRSAAVLVRRLDLLPEGVLRALLRRRGARQGVRHRAGRRARRPERLGSTDPGGVAAPAAAVGRPPHGPLRLLPRPDPGGAPGPARRRDPREAAQPDRRRPAARRRRRLDGLRHRLPPRRRLPERRRVAARPPRRRGRAGAVRPGLRPRALPDGRTRRGADRPDHSGGDRHGHG